MMAMALTTTEVTHTKVKKIVFDWTSKSDGTVTGTTSNAYDGEIICVVQQPASGGTQPANEYNVSVSDSDSIDVLGGLGTDLSNAADTVKNKAAGDELGAVADSTLSLSVSAAGDSKAGKTIVYIR